MEKEILFENLNVFIPNYDDDEEMDELFGYQSSDTESSISSCEDDLRTVHASCTNFLDTIDAFNEQDFRSHMRLKRTTVEYLIEKFQEIAAPSWHNQSGAGFKKTTAKKMIYMYMWYISNTITYRQLGNLFGVAKSTAWLSVNRVVARLISIAHEFVAWPSEVEIERTCKKFELKKNISGVIGAIDCTHITINAPTEDKEAYFDRKQSYSIVLQAVVDANKKFIDVYCGEPGSLHDSRVLRRSGLYRRAEVNYNNYFPNNTFLLADSAYPSTKWLVPPFKDHGNLTAQQKKFNHLHSSARIVVENAFGLLKGRFRRLLKYAEHRNIHAVKNLVSSACVLHNICVIKEDILEEDELVLEHIEEESIIMNEEEVQQSTAEEQRRDDLFINLIQNNII